MKEIKYQIYHKPTKTIQVVALIDFNNRVLDTYGIDEPVYGIPFEDVEWRVYIGRKDKNELEIYYRDIIKYVSNSYGDQIIGYVRLGNDFLQPVIEDISGATWMIDENFARQSEIIGNIDQHTELLK